MEDKPKHIECLTWHKHCPNRELFEREIEALSEKTELTIRLNQEAIAKSDRLMDERLSRMNEFREALKDQSASFATRLELDLLNKQIEDLRLSRATLEGKASTHSVYIGYLITIVGMVIAIAVSLLRTNVQ